MYFMIKLVFNLFLKNKVYKCCIRNAQLCTSGLYFDTNQANSCERTLKCFTVLQELRCLPLVLDINSNRFPKYRCNRYESCFAIPLQKLFACSHYPNQNTRIVNSIVIIINFVE